MQLSGKKRNRYLDFTLQYLTAGFQVVNLQHSEVQDRVMLTGRHMVRDVSCKNCNSKLGWMYEFATEESQRYKEGRVILERALVRESEGFEHVPSDNSWVSSCCHHDAQSVQTTAVPLSVWMVFRLWSELRQLFVLCTILYIYYNMTCGHFLVTKNICDLVQWWIMTPFPQPLCSPTGSDVCKKLVN